MRNYFIKIIILLLISIAMTGCYKTITETKIEYISPEVPESLTSPCDPLPEIASLSTNGDLLISYISLRSSYIICASKVTSIKNILQSYDTIYTDQIMKYPEE